MDCPNLCSRSKHQCEWCQANRDVSHEYYTAKRVASDEWVTGYLVKDKETQLIEGILNSANDFAECAFIDESTLRLFEVEPQEDTGDHDAQMSTVFASNEEKPIFDYGKIIYKHRFSLDRSLDDYEETVLERCISMSIQFKYKTVACDKLIPEMQILCRDENNESHCLCLDLHDYTFKIVYKGDMTIAL